MTTFKIEGAPLVKTEDQRRAERRDRRDRPVTSHPSVILARVALPVLVAFGLFHGSLSLVAMALRQLLTQ